jgi:hypothetical protein
MLEQGIVAAGDPVHRLEFSLQAVLKAQVKA